MVATPQYPMPLRSPPTSWKTTSATGPLYGHPSLDPFRHELGGRHLALLEVPVGRALLHRREAPHAADHLEAAALVEQRLAGALLGAGEHRAHHHAVGAGGERLHDVAGVLDAAVGDHRHVPPRPRPRPSMAVTCGTPTPVTTRVVQIEPGPDADLDRVHAALDQRARRRRAVATLPPTSCASGKASRSAAIVWSTPSQWPCAESTTSTSHPASSSACARDRGVLRGADRRGDPQPAVLVLVGAAGTAAA